MKAVLFDFDGVIVDSEREKFSILKQLLQKEHCTLNDSQFRSFIGKKTAAFLEEQYPELSQEQIKKIVAAWRQARSAPRPFPEIGDIITVLKKKGMLLGVVTGSEKGIVLCALENLGVRDIVDVIISGEDAPSKPLPDGYELAITALGVAAHDVVVIEDSPAGVEAARKAGAHPFSVITESLEVEKSFSHHRELLEYFSGI